MSPRVSARHEDEDRYWWWSVGEGRHGDCVPPLDPEKVAEARRLYGRGVRTWKIAKRLGASVRQIGRYVWRRRMVPPLLAARWRREVRAGAASTVELAERDGWSRSTVQRYVYGEPAGAEALDAPDQADRSDQRPTPAELWEWRETRAWAEWSRIRDMPPKSIANYYRRRGWGCEVLYGGEGSGARGSRISHAPCTECGRHGVPVGELSDGRRCARCEARIRAVDAAPGISHEELVRERERYLRRRTA